ncbi:helix-turn-helix domain-containing protein [Rhizobium halophilum]|uniref:helix-turn-helix domain-containing protein n=1 Tax=Rhizobium halophilum TaxID=2846852 RepID=UPI001EFD6C6E|nr:AraC family transcriptional regulator [Rhizobium halophilum]MCF6369383.1 AraC family transcriptional regulator [Rhizobium halophilum]
MPPLAYLAFRALAASPMKQVWWHLGAPLSVALAMATLPLLVDPLLAVIFIVYGLLLFRLTASNSNAVAEAPLNREVPALRAARLTAGLMIFFAVTDAIVSLTSWVYGQALVPTAVGLLNLVAIAVVLVYYFLPEPQSPLAAGVTAGNAEPSPDDRLLVAKVQAALDYDKLYGREDLSLARLARSAGLPPRDVSAAINRTTGLNVSQFVNNRRVSEACRLLQETDKPVTTVMFDSGFGTKSNFNREFRRVTGTSPSQWRAKKRQGGNGAQ